MRLRAKLALGLTAMLAVLVLAMAWLSWLGVRDEIRAGAAKQLFSLVSYAAQGMDNDLRLATDTVRAVAQSVPAEAVGSPAALAQYMGRLPMPMGGFERCIAIAPDGRPLAQQPAQPPIGNQSFAGREYFRRLMAERQAVISRPFLGTISHLPVVAIAVPRIGTDGAVELVVQCSFSLNHERIFGEVQSARIGRSGYLYVATREGQILLHPDRARILADATSGGANAPAGKAGDGFEGTEEGENSAGVRALMSVRQLRAANWFVAAVYPLEEAYAPLREAGRRVILINVLVLLACAACAWLLAGLLVRPLERLTRHVGVLRERPQTVVHQLPLRNDEIGALAMSFNGLLAELRERENSLRASEEKFTKAFHAIPDFVSITRLRDGLVLDVNEGFEKLTGYSAAEIVGRSFVDIGLWADPVERAEMVSRIMRDGAEHDAVHHFRTRSGEVRTVLGSAVRIDIGGEPCLIAIARDITGQLRTQEALRLSEEKFSKVFHASPDAILITRPQDGRVIEANESFCQLTGYGPDEVLGGSLAGTLHIWNDPALRLRFIAILKERGQVSGFEHDIRRKDGELRHCMVSAVAIDIGGAPCLISIVRDVTELRRAEEEIRNINVALEHRVQERTAKLEETVREMESFSYSISHDLRAPLRAIAGYAKIIDEDYAAQFDAEGRRLLERIAGGAVRMGELIDDLLDFARIGRAELKRAPIDMAGLAREVLAELPEAAGGRKLEVRIGAMPMASADRSLVRQVWSNLLSNALKYTRRCDAALIEAGGREERGEAHYFVRDNGAGFDMAYADKLFRVFQRLHRDADFEGTGVGLAIVARIVERHGGRVWAESAPGQGATFHFTLPLAS
ncbi:MAG: PAS domain S-box protein [Zoogloeaceae bacterium]|nr:PAS domain S-box protein [Zoogloeaceae bacterium]